MHVYEIEVGRDACEPNVEGDLSSFNRRCYGRHSLHIKTYHQENIVSTELKEEHSSYTKDILKASAINWRADHSSPFVSASKYKVSPSVDAILYPKTIKPEPLTMPASLTSFR